MKGYLNSNDKSQCFGCEACVQVCSKAAIAMVEDEAKGSASPKVSSINMPFTVVWAIATDDIRIITTTAKNALNCFIYFFILFVA